MCWTNTAYSMSEQVFLSSHINEVSCQYICYNHGQYLPLDVTVSCAEAPPGGVAFNLLARHILRLHPKPNSHATFEPCQIMPQLPHSPSCLPNSRQKSDHLYELGGLASSSRYTRSHNRHSLVARQNALHCNHARHSASICSSAASPSRVVSF